jgi:hypothetical protein
MNNGGPTRHRDLGRPTPTPRLGTRSAHPADRDRSVPPPGAVGELRPAGRAPRVRRGPPPAVLGPDRGRGQRGGGSASSGPVRRRAANARRVDRRAAALPDTPGSPAGEQVGTLPRRRPAAARCGGPDRVAAESGGATPAGPGRADRDGRSSIRGIVVRPAVGGSSRHVIADPSLSSRSGGRFTDQVGSTWSDRAPNAPG